MEEKSVDSEKIKTEDLKDAKPVAPSEPKKIEVSEAGEIAEEPTDQVAAKPDSEARPEKPAEEPKEEPAEPSTQEPEKEEEAADKSVPTPSSLPTLPPIPDDERPPIIGFVKKPRHRKRVALIIVVALLIIIGGSAGGYMLVQRKTAAPKPVATVTKKPAAAKPAKPAIEPTDQQLAKFITPTTGETWLPTPEKVSALGYSTDDEADTTYYQVGTHGQNSIYMSVTALLGEYIVLYEKTPSGTVYAIEHPSSTFKYTSDDDTGFANGFAKTVKIDSTTHYDSLSVPGNGFSLPTGETVGLPQSQNDIGSVLVSDMTTDGVTTSVVKTIGGSKIVKVERQYTDTGLTAINYELQLPIGTDLDLAYAPIANDLAKYTWNNGVNVTETDPKGHTDTSNSTISAIVRGCGSSDTSVSWDYKASDSDFVAAGKTADGQTVYAFASDNNSIVQKAYSEYVSFGKDDSFTPVSMDEFLKNHAIVAFKDGSGEWLVYTRDQYAETGGCAKPVVYLYPTHAENVNVQLGAKITKSDPQYNPSKGWTAYAQPNGQLTVAGKQYGSLFWEGQGDGFYPAITSGTVVKHADALSTMKAQLKQQGLTASETNDFVAYWQGKIPNEPYVRLTWFNTAEMNELAPLNVKPKPDTLIRVFLDMDGYTVLPKLPAQRLINVPRKGFTVVEWGGLSQSALQ